MDQPDPVTFILVTWMTVGCMAAGLALMVSGPHAAGTMAKVIFVQPVVAIVSLCWNILYSGTKSMLLGPPPKKKGKRKKKRP